jgi:acyl carrier protein
MNKEEACAKIHAKIVAIAKKLGRNATKLRYDAVLLHEGLLDSAGILELIFWIESEYDVEFDQEELSVDNFGTILQMVDFVETKRG